MTFHHSDILQIAKLARIALSEESSTLSHISLAKDIERIVGMIDQISMIETDDIPPMHHPLEVTQPLRTDEIKEAEVLNRDTLLQLTPENEAGLLLVPTVIEE